MARRPADAPCAAANRSQRRTRTPRQPAEQAAVRLRREGRARQPRPTLVRAPAHVDVHAEIDEALAELGTDVDMAGATPTTVAGQGAYETTLSPKHDGGLLGGLTSRSTQRPARRCASGSPRRAPARRCSARGHGHLLRRGARLRRDRHAAGHREGRRHLAATTLPSRAQRLPSCADHRPRRGAGRRRASR